MRGDFETVLQMAQALIQNDVGDQPVSRDLIARSVDAIIRMNARWASTVDRAQVIAELETRFSIWIGRERVLESDVGHVPWLNAARKSGWRYWPRYREWLDGTWSPNSVDAVDRVTDRVIGLLEDPNREGAWDRRGLVVGHVQSGKTANYAGLISKAADAGYKVLIVLAGTHKNLRSQTQMRLDEGFLGYETMPPAAARSSSPRTIGVGLINSDPSIMPDYVTNRADNGDFNRTVANNMGISPGQRPLLFVVKKNAHVLRNLLSWVEERVANAYERTSGRRIVESVPLLLIDDEADHASVDTGEQSFDENDNPDPDYDPKTINRLIRRLLFAFEKSAYVGYTATPFANIFIHEKGRTAEEGEDLFPRSFIINLPAPSNYVGPVRLFGLESADDPGSRVEPLDLVRHVRDHAASEDPRERSGWMPPRHRNGHIPLFQGRDEIPDSLKEAIHSFLLACAARKVRSAAPQHSSMLIHVTRYNSVQAHVRRQVDEYLSSLRRRIVYGEGAATGTLMDEFRRLWLEDFVPSTANVRRITDDSSVTDIPWDGIRPLLAQVVQDVQTRQIDGSAGDILDYETHRETGFTVIAIGGDKLSRGLTLEGLMVSYFLRATRMYDTLMQMGRWFGYRAAHLDLCRLYTSPDLEEWFEHVTEASEELRREFDHMAAVGGTPRDYGLKVQSHPMLMVTSSVKMRNSTELRLSFSGNVQETVVFYRDEERLGRNLQAVETLIRKMGPSFQQHPTRERPQGRHHWEGTFLWDDVPANEIVSFLHDYSTHPDAVKVNARILADFIEKKTREGELTSWTVAVLSGEALPATVGGKSVRLIHRSVNTRCYSLEQQKQDQRYLIRRLLAPRDEAIDLGKDEYAAALAISVEEYKLGHAAAQRSSPPEEPSGIHIRHIRGLGDPSGGMQGHPERGLLLLYPLSPVPAEISFDGPVMAFGVSFPASSTSTTVTYKVNNIYWNQEYGEEQ